MMLDLTGKPYTATATGPAPRVLVVDVGLYFASMTLALKLITFDGAGITFDVDMETSMDPDSTTDWVPLGSFATIVAAGVVTKETFTGLLRYVRWNVVGLGAATSALFTISGVARNP